MRDDVVLDTGVNLGCHDSAIEEFILAAIGPEPNDACCPGAAQSGDLDELIKRSRVYVDRFTCSGSGREARLRLRR